jgi:hypothetical protein
MLSNRTAYVLGKEKEKTLGFFLKPISVYYAVDCRMTLEQQNDLSALTIVNAMGSCTKNKIAVAFYALKIDADLFFDDQLIKKHIKIDDDLISITKAGQVYLNWLNHEKSNEILQSNKMKVDLANAERILKDYPYTRLIAWAAFIFGAIGLYLSLAQAMNLWPYYK